MASNLDNSARSERHSIVYDDVASQANLSTDSITIPEDAQEKVDTGTLVKEDERAKTPGQTEVTKESNKIAIHGQNELKNVDGEKGAERKDGSSEVISKDSVDKNDHNCSESQRDKRKIRKDSDKELWTPVKGDSKESTESKSSDSKETGEIVGQNSDNHPTKPPRRHPPNDVCHNLHNLQVLHQSLVMLRKVNWTRQPVMTGFLWNKNLQKLFANLF